MGKVIRGCRRGKGSVFKAHTTGRKGAVGFKRNDFAERHGYVKGVVKQIMHDPGRGAPVAVIQFKDPYRYQRVNSLVAAPEGLYSGQFVFAGKKGKETTISTIWLQSPSHLPPFLPPFLSSSLSLPNLLSLSLFSSCSPPPLLPLNHSASLPRSRINHWQYPSFRSNP